MASGANIRFFSNACTTFVDSSLSISRARSSSSARIARAFSIPAAWPVWPVSKEAFLDVNSNSF